MSKCLYCPKKVLATGLCGGHYSRWVRRQPMEAPMYRGHKAASFRDLGGKVFGRLTVVDRKENTKRGMATWLCHCTCGRTKTIVGRSLVNGDTKSCGCLHSENTRKLAVSMTKHGYARRSKIAYQVSEYPIWTAMKQRCGNPNNSHYKSYGGRGIVVCDRWANSFELFLEDMGRRPSSDHSLDRIDPYRGYEPGNVKWATTREQNNNKRHGNALREIDRLRSLVISLGGDPNKV